MSDHDDVILRLPNGLTEAYLARVGVDDAGPPTVDTLRTIHRAHLRAVPFENFDVHLGIPIVLDGGAFVDKIVQRSRGGFCYELNAAFASLLCTLGFAVELSEARFFGAAGLTGRFGHLCLVVHMDGTEYLADVGFGRGCFDEPVLLDRRSEQLDTAGRFELRDSVDGTVDLLRDGVRQYRVASRHRRLIDFADGCTFHQSSPESAHAAGTLCTLRTHDGRITLAGRRLIESIGIERHERRLDREDFGATLVETFGIRLNDSETDRLFASDPFAAVDTVR